jgi:RimJ/RimL family protein N-acetyltransferase
VTRPDLVLETQRLLLRPFTEADVDDLTRLYGDPAVMRHLGDGSPLDRAASWRQVAIFMGHMEMRGYSILAVVEKATGQFLGRAGPWFPAGWPALEVGWVIDPSRWGEGFATEAGRASLAYCWRTLRATEVCSLIRPANAASIRVAVKLGATLHRVIPDFIGGPAEMYMHPRPDSQTG